MENHLKMTQETLAAEQEEYRETQELVNVFNAHIQAFVTVRNKNAFIAFLIFSDIYVYFTLFTLQVVVQRISDACDISVPIWQPPSPRSRLVPQWSS
jgi:hypothetical protein